MELKEAVEKTLEEMPDDFTIKSFLVQNKEEVTSMLLNEFNEEAMIERIKAAGRAEGKFNMLVKLVKNGRLSLEDAAEEIAMQADEFRKLMDQRSDV